MRRGALLVAATMSLVAFGAQAQTAVPLSSYADAGGWIDVQKLTCGQLAATYQEDADLLSTWYSGWYNGLAKKHMFNVKRAKDLTHEIIVYCKANQQKKVIQAIDVVFKNERAKRSVRME
jgi:inactivated superfamily I helicase